MPRYYVTIAERMTATHAIDTDEPMTEEDLRDMVGSMDREEIDACDHEVEESYWAVEEITGPLLDADPPDHVIEDRMERRREEGEDEIERRRRLM